MSIEQFHNKKPASLIKEGMKHLRLKNELKHLGLTRRELRKIPDEYLLWTDEGEVVCVRRSKLNRRLEVRDFLYEGGTLVASLHDTKKVHYRPERELYIVFGVGDAHHYNEEVKFYRALHKDTEPFLEVHDMWLVSEKFQELLKEHLPESFAGTVERDEASDLFLPKARRTPYLPFFESDDSAVAEMTDEEARKSVTVWKLTEERRREYLSNAKWDEKNRTWRKFD